MKGQQPVIGYTPAATGTDNPPDWHDQPGMTAAPEVTAA